MPRRRSAPGRSACAWACTRATPLVTEEGYVGIDVHRAARIAAAGHGGQVLVSPVDPRARRRRRPARPRRAPAQGPDARRSGSTSSATASSRRSRSLNQSNLPVQPTPFVGREKELGEVLALLGAPDDALADARPARAAREDAARRAGRRRGRGRFRARRLVGAAAGGRAIRSASVRRSARRSARGRAGRPHRRRSECCSCSTTSSRLLEAAPELGELLAACPSLRSARDEPRAPAAGGRARVRGAAARRAGSGRVLPLARASDRSPDFEPDEHVLAICRRLDHLPLALELAAARVKALSTGADPRAAGARAAAAHGRRPRRCRSGSARCAATIGWSYELLTTEEQEALPAARDLRRRLDARRGRAGGRRATSTRCSRSSRRAWLRFDERALLAAWRRSASSRTNCWTGSGELEEARRRHFDFYLALAAAEDTSAEGGYGNRSKVLLHDQENLRAAVDGAVTAGDRVGATELMVLLENFWVVTDPFEGARRFGELLATPGELPKRLRARALRLLCGLLFGCPASTSARTA